MCLFQTGNSDRVYLISHYTKHYLMQPQLPLVHQFLDKVSHEQHPGHHQHQWKDIRDGLQVPGEHRWSKCQCCC